MKPIEWSEMAKNDYFENIDYLEREWPQSVVNEFIANSNHVLNLISKGNISFKATNYKNVFEAVIVKQITLFYSVEIDKIILHRFWNNFKDHRPFSK